MVKREAALWKVGGGGATLNPLCPFNPLQVKSSVRKTAAKSVRARKL